MHEGRGCASQPCTVQPHLEHWVQVWVPQYKKDRKQLESVQKRAAKMGKSLEGKMYKERIFYVSMINFS